MPSKDHQQIRGGIGPNTFDLEQLAAKIEVESGEVL